MTANLSYSVLAGCFAVIVFSLVALAVIRSQGGSREAPTCASISSAGAEAKSYEPIWIGPVALDPGPELSSGTQIRWLAQEQRGYIVKSFLGMERSAVKVAVTGRNAATGARLLFSYLGRGYEERLEIDADADKGQAAFASSELVAFPGALAAPDLGVYGVTVENDEGRRWSRTVSVCSPVNPPRDPS